MKKKFISMLAFAGFAQSIAEVAAESGSLDESHVDAITAKLEENSSLKTKLEASLGSEVKLQGELKTAQDALVALQTTHTSIVEAKTKSEADLATAKAALEGKGENPFNGGKENPQQDAIDPKFKTSYDTEKYGE